MEHVYRKALKSAGLVTPKQIASSNARAIATALEQNIPNAIAMGLTRTKLELRAEEIQQKARRHLKRMSVRVEQQSSDSESDSDESDVDFDKWSNPVSYADALPGYPYTPII